MKAPKFPVISFHLEDFVNSDLARFEIRNPKLVLELWQTLWLEDVKMPRKCEEKLLSYFGGKTNYEKIFVFPEKQTRFERSNLWKN